MSSTVESTPAIYIWLKSRPSKMNRASRRGIVPGFEAEPSEKQLRTRRQLRFPANIFFSFFLFLAPEIIAGNDQFLFYDSCWEENCRLICSWMKLLSGGTRSPISRWEIKARLYDARADLIHSEIIFIEIR